MTKAQPHKPEANWIRRLIWAYAILLILGLVIIGLRANCRSLIVASRDLFYQPLWFSVSCAPVKREAFEYRASRPLGANHRLAELDLSQSDAGGPAPPIWPAPRETLIGKYTLRNFPQGSPILAESLADEPRIKIPDSCIPIAFDMSRQLLLAQELDVTDKVTIVMISRGSSNTVLTNVLLTNLQVLAMIGRDPKTNSAVVLAVPTWKALGRVEKQAELFLVPE